MCPDHVHMLVEIPPSMSVSSFVGYLKGKSTLMIFERHANLKYKYLSHKLILFLWIYVYFHLELYRYNPIHNN